MSRAALPLHVDIVVTRGNVQVSTRFTAAAGETLAILGPNGAGKSTILAVVAGLLAPDQGSVLLGDRELTRYDHGRRSMLVPEQRRVGLMGQDPLLFPHLSALDNVAFGPRSQGSPRGEARRLAAEWLDRMALGTFADRRPAQLSGGQRQRVALARALAAAPDLLLLDEPLGALDARTAPEIRQVLRTHLQHTGTTSVLVTHDALDAAVLADRVIVLEAGTIVDEGPTATVLTAPRTEFGAALAGLNLLTGTADRPIAGGSVGSVTCAGGMRVSGVATDSLTAGEPVAAVFPPAAVAVFLKAFEGSPRNLWPAVVTSMQTGTAAIRLHTHCHQPDNSGGSAEVAVDLTPAAVAELGVDLGTEIFLSVKATEVRLYAR